MFVLFVFMLGWRDVKDGQVTSCFLGDLETKEADKTVHCQVAAGGEGCEALTSHRGTGL